ncbi:MAG: flagellar basal body L-ring protein FlgH [Burkholderiales bacterium]|nr:flagellar basal body L-ring protein FlgH [Burkholderiales bacterium]
MRRLNYWLSLLLLGALSACASIMPSTPKVDIAEPTTRRPTVPVVAPVNNGSIFQANAYRPLFEDHRARLPGDTITVQIVEKVTATAKSTSNVEKTGAVEGSITALPMLPSSALTKLGAGGSSANKFTGKGDTENSNEFTGTITATVIDVLPNGHLLVAGEKQIGVNHNVDVLRFSGQVDPRAIQPGNSVASAQIANVRIEQRGRGAQGDAQQIGWLSRFFLTLAPF